MNVALTYTFFLEDVFVQELAEGKTFPIDHPEVITATEYYLRAIFAPPKYDSHSLFLYAYFLEHCGRYEDAEVNFFWKFKIFFSLTPLKKTKRTIIYNLWNLIQQMQLVYYNMEIFCKIKENLKMQRKCFNFLLNTLL